MHNHVKFIYQGYGKETVPFSEVATITLPHKEPCMVVGLKPTTLHFWVVL